MWALKRWLVLGTVCLFAVLIIWQYKANDSTAQFGSNSLVLERAVTEDARIKGLSGRSSLPENYGMLFVFEESARHCMWMKDMNFSIDIVWLDTSKRVVDVAERVAPETYPESFCSDVPAKYVIEVNAGSVQNARLHRGDTVSF